MAKLFDRSTRAGFTLVELIIVIAILGILAGIAIPVYNGYIKKADKAADLVLLDAVNQAFAAACLENGFDAANVASAHLTGNEKVTGVADVTLKDGVTPVAFRSGAGIVLSSLSVGGSHVELVPLSVSSEAVSASFLKYFGDNANTELKTFKASDAAFANGVFAAPNTDGESEETASVAWTRSETVDADGYYTFTNGTNEIKVSEADLTAMNFSTFLKDMEVATLTGDIDKVIDAASQVITEANIDVLPGFEDYLNGKGISKEDSKAVAEGLVLYVADLTAGKNAADVLESITNGNFATQFRSSIHSTNDKTTAVVDAALAYAMVEAFANTEEGKTATVSVDGVNKTVPDYLAEVNSSLGSGKSGTENLSAVLTMLQNVNDHCNDFYWYINDEADSGAKASTDLAGYISAMNAISTNSGNIDLDTYLTQGLSGDYMTGLISQFKNTDSEG